MARTPEQFVLEMKEINPDIEIVGKYTKAVDRVKVKCLKCGKVWEPKAYSLTQGKGCPSCSAKRGAINNKGKTGLKTTEQFVRDLKYVDDSIQLLGEYQNGHTNISLHCLRCNHDWEAKPYSVLQGHGCPRCAKSGTSFMEQFILLSFQEALGSEKILSRDKKAIGMELDIYIPEMMLAIEPGNWWLHKRSLYRDKKKRELCVQKGIRLIIIYDKFPENQQLPFNENIYTFAKDLNIADHSLIRKLVTDLFEDVGVDASFSADKWEYIESSAYDNAKSMTHETFIERMRDIHPFIQVVGRYQNANKRIKVHCKSCGFEWNAVPANLLSGDGCRKCGIKKAHEGMVKSQEIFVKEVAVQNPDIDVIGAYTGRHSHVRARCKICGYEWEPYAASLLRGSNHKGAITIHRKLQYCKS